MKRTPLTRKTPLRRTGSLKRSAFKRKAAKPNPAGSDPIHLAIIRALACARCGKAGPNEAHHPRDFTGMGRKAPDRDAFPLCGRCHRTWLHDSGVPKEERRAFQREAVEQYRQFADFPIIFMVFPRDRWLPVGAYATTDEAERARTTHLLGMSERVWSWIGARAEAAKLLADPEYVPEEKSA